MTEQSRAHAQCKTWSAAAHDDIIKRLMANVGMPNSTSLYQAFKQFANELHASAHAETAPLTPAEGDTVAWIAFAANGNIRFWTVDEQRAKDEKASGLDMRAFTLAELIALVSRLGQAEAQVENARKQAIDDCAKLVDNFDCHLAGYPNEEAKSFFEAGVADTCNILADHVRALSHSSTNRQSTEG